MKKFFECQQTHYNSHVEIFNKELGVHSHFLSVFYDHTNYN